jgi:type II secretion system protein I
MRSRAERGFTLIEVLVALGIMAVGLLGILALQRGAASASGYSRRATEAAILAEDKLEELRTTPLLLDREDADRVDAAGMANDDGPFDRDWTLRFDGGRIVTITVKVTWYEADGAHAITFVTQREAL